MNNMFPPYAALIQQTNANYQTAISYYSQRRIKFEEALSIKGEQIYSQYIAALSEKAKIFNEIVVKKAQAAISAGQYTAQQKKDDGIYAVWIEDIFNSANLQDKKMNAQKLGAEFERFMADNAVSSEQLQRVSNFIQNNINQLLSLVGSLPQESWSVGGQKKDTRTDLAISKNGNIGQMELTTALDLEQEVPDGLNAAAELEKIIVDAGIDLNVFGFQLKAYGKGDQDKRWSNAQAIAGRINELLNVTKDAWSSNYTVNYPTWYLSKYLINIINPVNIGNITFEGIEFMDNWLQHVRLYMETIFTPSDKKGVPSDYYGGGTWVIKRKIATEHVLIRQISGNNFSGFSNNNNATRWSRYKTAIRDKNGKVIKNSQGKTRMEYVRVASIRNL